MKHDNRWLQHIQNQAPIEYKTGFMFATSQHSVTTTVNNVKNTNYQFQVCLFSVSH